MDGIDDTASDKVSEIRQQEVAIFVGLQEDTVANGNRPISRTVANLPSETTGATGGRVHASCRPRFARGVSPTTRSCEEAAVQRSSMILLLLVADNRATATPTNPYRLYRLHGVRDYRVCLIFDPGFYCTSIAAM